MDLQRAKIPEAICIVVLLAIYLLTLPPSLTWAHYGADGGDFVAAVARGSLPHPPGYPIYLLVANVFFKIPWGDPAWRLNLMSAVMMVLAGGFIVASVRRWLKSGLSANNANLTNPSRTFASSDVVSVCVGISFGLAPLVWSQALIVEVYALAIAFVAAIIYLLVIDAPRWLVGIVWGIGLGAHPIIIFLAPIIFWRTHQALNSLIQLLLCAFIGWDVAYGPLLLMESHAPSPWGQVNTLGGWWAYVSAQIYHGYLFSAPIDTLPQRSITLLDTLIRQFTPIGAAIAIMGWIVLWRRARALAITSTITFCLIGAFTIFYNTVDSIVYVALALPVLSLFVALGLASLVTWLRERWRWSTGLIFLLPIFQLMFFWSEMDLRGAHTAMDWATQVLNTAPPNALMVTAEDKATFTLWYAHDVLGTRPDVVVVDRDLWGFESYRNMMASKIGTDLSLDDVARETHRPLFDAGVDR